MKNQEKEKLNEVESSVLKIYEKVNPSLYKIEKNNNFFKEFKNQRELSLRNTGAFNVLKNSRNVIYIGGGTGEKALVDEAVNKANIKIIDVNSKAINRAEKLFNKYQIPLKTECKSLFELNEKDLEQFDLIICEGVLHHTYDPQKALRHLCKIVPSKSYLIIALAETNGWYQRQLQRNFVRFYSKNEDEIISRAKIYFSDHIERAHKFGLRSKDSIIYDTFVNPQIKPTDIEDILKILREEKFDYINSFPNLNCPINICPPNNGILNVLDFEKYKDYLEFCKVIWRTGFHHPFNFFYDSDKIKKLLSLDEKLRNLHIQINNREDNPDNLKLIQSGTLAYGLSYFTIIKE